MSLRRRTTVLAAVLLVAGCGISTVSRSAPGPAEGTATTTALADTAIATPTVPAGGSDVPPLSWEALGEPGVGGRVTDVAIDPDDGDHLLVGGDLVGIGVSFDGGATWEGTTGLTNPEVGRFTFHPTRPGEVWVGTMGGPFVSLDGGRSWQERRAGLPPIELEAYSAPVEEVLVDPADPDHLLALGGSHREWEAQGSPAWGAVWESGDGGATWARLSTVAGGTNLVDGQWLGDGALVVAALEGGVWRSEDGGRTWAAGAGLPADVRAVASHPSGPRTVWAAVGSSLPGGGAAPGGVWRSDDGGATWAGPLAGLGSRASLEGSPDHTARYDAVVVAPSDPNVLLTSNVAFGSEAVYRSTDGGWTWATVLDDAGFGRPATAYSTPAGAEALAIDARDPARAVLGNAELVLRTTDGGRTWDDLTSDARAGGGFAGRGYSGLVANRVVADPAQPGTLVLCGMDGANPWLSSDGGASWRKPLASWDRWGGCHDATPAGGGVWWALLGQSGRFNGVARFDASTGEWRVATGAGLPERGEYVGDLGAVEAVTGADGAPVLLVSLGGGLLRSVDDGRSWQPVEGPARVTDLEDDPRRPGLVYVATGSGVWASEDAGAHVAALVGSPAGVTRLALTGGRLYAAAFRQGDGGLHRLTGPGAWEQLLADALVADVAADPADPAHLIAVLNDHPYHDRVASAGVLRSLDGGRTWAVEVAGLSVTRVSTVAFDPAVPGRALLGTFGRGFYRSR